MTMRIAYLGPEATFTEAAARAIPALTGAELVPAATVHDAMNTVRDGDADGAVVPLENSVEGSVNATVDSLVRGRELVITAELLLPVRFTLMARPGTDLNTVRRIITHPVAEAQCRTWVGSKLPGATIAFGTSTAGAAETVAAGTAGPDGQPYDAAIAPPLAAERYGLESLATDVGEDPDAVTRFVLVRRPVAPPRASGADKTSLVAYLRADHAGALLEILEQFATRGVNLTRIESRPTGHGMGQYCFVIDAEGHIEDERVAEALRGLHRVCGDVRYLGSYPRADGVRPPVGRGTSNADFQAASAWVETLRNPGLGT